MNSQLDKTVGHYGRRLLALVSRCVLKYYEEKCSVHSGKKGWVWIGGRAASVRLIFRAWISLSFSIDLHSFRLPRD